MALPVYLQIDSIASLPVLVINYATFTWRLINQCIFVFFRRYDSSKGFMHTFDASLKGFRLFRCI
jgi:hypothetical protein